ncbi:MAG: TetR/AcrR family transcriptional regulator [Pseudomonadota bacterium]
MARRSDHTKEELTELAIRKGIEIIDKNGVSGFSARRIARAMGYTVGTLYHVFGDLDQYMLHLNARILDEWHEDLSLGLRRTRKDPVRFLAQGYVDFARKHYNRWTTLFEFRMTRQTPLPGWYTAKLSRLFELVENAILPHAGGDLRKARRSAKVLWAGIHGICVLSLSGKLGIVGAEKPEILVKSLLDTYLPS